MLWKNGMAVGYQSVKLIQFCYFPVVRCITKSISVTAPAFCVGRAVCDVAKEIFASLFLRVYDLLQWQFDSN